MSGDNLPLLQCLYLHLITRFNFHTAPFALMPENSFSDPNIGTVTAALIEPALAPWCSITGPPCPQKSLSASLRNPLPLCTLSENSAPLHSCSWTDTQEKRTDFFFFFKAKNILVFYIRPMQLAVQLVRCSKEKPTRLDITQVQPCVLRNLCGCDHLCQSR